jgi:TRAP-type C4-dicarboxylate transport system permease small subunit
MKDEPQPPPAKRPPSAARRRDVLTGLNFLALILFAAAVIFAGLRLFAGFHLIEDGKLQIVNSFAAFTFAALLGVGALIAIALLLAGTQYRRRRPPRPAPPDDTSESATCLACGAEIAAGQAQCAQCGWTYRKDAQGPAQ